MGTGLAALAEEKRLARTSSCPAATLFEGVSGAWAIAGERGSLGRVLSPMCGRDRGQTPPPGGFGWLGRGALGLGLLAAMAAPSSALPSAELVDGRAAGALARGKYGIARRGLSAWEASVQNPQVGGQRIGELCSLRGGGKPGIRVDGGPPTRHGVMRFFQKRLAGEKKADKPKISLTRTESVYLPASPMAALSVAFYISTSLGMTLINKHIFTSFPFPLAVTAFQLIVSLILLWVFGLVGQHVPAFAFAPPPEFDTNIAREVMPLTFLYMAMLSSTNYCLQYVDISFYQILRSLVIPMNLSYSYFRFGQVPNPVVLTSCLAVMSGFVLGSVTELNFSTHGFVSGVLSSWFVALYSITVKSTLPLVAGNTWRLMQYTTSLSLFLIAPMIVASGEAVAVASTVATPGLAFNMFVAGLFGFLINLAYFALIKFASPLSTHISGCVKSALQTVLGVIIFGNKVMPANALGIALTIVGSVIYSLERLKR